MSGMGRLGFLGTLRSLWSSSCLGDREWLSERVQLLFRGVISFRVFLAATLIASRAQTGIS